MPARALLVLLVMLNLGVATWWLLRPAADPVPRRALSADVPRLQLLHERTGSVVAPVATEGSAVPAAGEIGDGPEGASPDEADAPEPAADAATPGSPGTADEDAPR